MTTFRIKHGVERVAISATLDDYGLTPSEFRVYVRLLFDKNCRDSQSEIAIACRLTEREVEQAFNCLVAFGLLNQVGLHEYVLTLDKEWMPSKKISSIRRSVVQPNTYKKGGVS